MSVSPAVPVVVAVKQFYTLFSLPRTNKALIWDTK